ncbi:MAG: TetR/AcrR family transcriptional regulator [Myxococcota bacterium]|nr:TetR/AcrR family transcriptional regulator [bacterium]MDP7073150.1 TetR/AcrR family transcriptional regulator [Myxococcota bacterium]MDP7300319.1 TetR/AcrR family transcriptional regulator [Myxococcota bacterium]MDP7434302.1 TetR/AcrR family transcriptional regulator [Myxococcota bacterium]HJO25210.1 TetR/AcrR family transcriptional regulator [Myxococcota bacterium]
MDSGSQAGADPMAEPAATGRLEKRKRERRLRIYDVAMDLFRTQGFERTTVSQIAEAADIVPATFFNHFQSKNALLGQMTAEVLDALELLLVEEFRAAESTRERLTGFVARATDQIAETRGLARDVLLEFLRSESEPGQQPPYIRRIHEPFAAMLREGQERGEVRLDQDAVFLAEMVVGILNAALTNWLADPNYLIEQRLRQAAQFAWEAIRSA